MRVYGFDIDGVLTNDDNGQENLWLTEASQYFNQAIKKTAFRIDEAFDVTRDQVYEFFRDRGPYILKRLEIREGCQEVLQRLAKKAPIHLITARNEAFSAITLEWLKEHEIPYTSLTMNPNPKGSYSKGARCQELGVQFFVDDNYENCLDTHKHGVLTLLFHTTHNKEYESIVPRVYTWKELESYL